MSKKGGFRMPQGGGGMGGMMSQLQKLQDEMVKTQEALADETRLQIMGLLSDGRERYAQEIMAELGLSQSATSRHLTLLESSGLLTVRKEGTAKFYSLNASRSRALLDSLKRLLLS